MTFKIVPKLEKQQTPGAEVVPGISENCWHLQIPSGPQGSYRLAQLDDYRNLGRKSFPWQPPLNMRLRARVSASEMPGTWGFGLWNDPFSLSLGLGGGTRRFPTLPNAVWYFYASPENYLSFRDDKPSQGFLVQTFRSSQLPSPLLGSGSIAFPVLFWPWLARKLRPLFRKIIAEESFSLKIDATQWHEFSIRWSKESVIFTIDNQLFQSTITPNPPLGLVIWIDNQYAAFHPNGKISFGNLENKNSSWLEIENLFITQG